MSHFARILATPGEEFLRHRNRFGVTPGRTYEDDFESALLGISLAVYCHKKFGRNSLREGGAFGRTSRGNRGAG
jgi:hypothetical protein